METAISDVLKIVVPAILSFLLGLFLAPLSRRCDSCIEVRQNTKRLFDLAGARDLPAEIRSAERDIEQGIFDGEVYLKTIKRLNSEVEAFRKEYERWKDRNVVSRLGRRFCTGTKASMLLERAQQLQNYRKVPGQPPAPAAQMRPLSSNISSPTLERNRDNILSLLEREDVKVVRINGMAGIGKSTLLNSINAHLVNQESQREQLFDYVIWVTATRVKDLMVDKIREDITRWLHLTVKDGETFSNSNLTNFLQNKRVLLLLDNLWYELDFKDIGIDICNAEGSNRQRCHKVVFTTRDQKVLMKADKSVPLQCLEKNEAWELFKSKLGGWFKDSDEEIPKLAKDMAQECKGLPLALLVLAKAMADNKDEEDWHRALQRIKSSQPSMEEEVDLFQVLKYSYDNLNSDDLKQAFLCCSFWPEGFHIRIDKLVECWMGMGLIDCGDIEEACNKGLDMVQVLKAKSMFEPVGEEGHVRHVKVHDMIRDMALQIQSKKCFVKAGMGLLEAPRNMKRWEQAETVSLMHNRISSFPTFEDEGDLQQLKDLRSLMVQKNKIVNIPTQLFTSIRFLQYLNLWKTRLYEFPPQICNLEQLRYLNLSYTSISSVPRKLGKLRQLRYLLLRNTMKVKKIPPDVIPSRLLVLDIYVSGEVKDVEVLKKLKYPAAIGVTVSSEAMLSELQRLTHLQVWRIQIKGFQESSVITFDLRQSLAKSHIRDHLQELMISSLCSLKELYVDFDQADRIWKLKRLEVLWLVWLKELKGIIWRGVAAKDFFPQLRSLVVVGCLQLTNLWWVLELRCLEKLKVEHCKGMTSLINYRELLERLETNADSFPRLKRLTLSTLTNLKLIYDHALQEGEILESDQQGLRFPSLEKVEIFGCDKLRSLSFHTDMKQKNKLRGIHGSETWWKKLEWKDPSMKDSFQKFFRNKN